MARVLIIEDQPVMAQLLKLLLIELGHEPTVAVTLKEAEEILSEKIFALITLDVHLPDGDGFEFCRKLRKRKKFAAPIILLTSEVSAESVVRGFEAGADDYLRKPIDGNELRARLRGHLGAVAEGAVLEFGGLRLDPDRRTAHYKGRLIELKGLQYDLLSHLLKRPEVVVTREQLIEAMGAGEDVVDRTVDSHVSQLRKKLKDQGVSTFAIASVYGVGYRVE